MEVGVKRAPRDDLDKLFSTSKRVVVWGVRHDTDKWAWGILEES